MMDVSEIHLSPVWHHGSRPPSHSHSRPLGAYDKLLKAFATTNDTTSSLIATTATRVNNHDALSLSSLTTALSLGPPVCHPSGERLCQKDLWNRGASLLACPSHRSPYRSVLSNWAVDKDARYKLSDDDDDDESYYQDHFEAAVITAAKGDGALAALLTPLLYAHFISVLKDIIQSRPGGGDTSSGISHTPNHTPRRSGSTSAPSPDKSARSSDSWRKRRRQSSSERRKRSSRDDDDDGDKGSGSDSKADSTSNETLAPLLACPFHKYDPNKYTIQRGNTGSRRKGHYRSCAGPGFRSIQRLKEHLKRIHTPVQCERCYRIFSNPDRAVSARQLSEHLRSEIPCERGDPRRKEGIRAGEWVEIERHNRKKNQEIHRVEKWFDIWRVLFPNREPPSTPWYDDDIFLGPRSPLAGDSEQFTQIFLTMLEHRLQNSDFTPPHGMQCFQDMRESLGNIARTAFMTYARMHDGPNLPADSSPRTAGSRHAARVHGRSSSIRHHNVVGRAGAVTTNYMAPQPFPSSLAASATPPSNFGVQSNLALYRAMLPPAGGMAATPSPYQQQPPPPPTALPPIAPRPMPLEPMSTPSMALPQAMSDFPSSANRYAPHHHPYAYLATPNHHWPAANVSYQAMPPAEYNPSHPPFLHPPNFPSGPPDSLG